MVASRESNTAIDTVAVVQTIQHPYRQSHAPATSCIGRHFRQKSAFTLEWQLPLSFSNRLITLTS